MKATLKRTWPVLVAYGLFSMWGVVCFITSIVLTSGGFGVSANSLAGLFGVIVAAAVGHVFGNFLGLVRLRLAVVVVLFTGLFILAMLSGAVVGVIALFAIVAVFAAVGGYLGIASRLDVVASWFPLTFAVGGAIIWMNRHRAVETFNTGSKHQVWDLFTLGCLAGAVFLMLVFLAARNSLGLTVWQEVARPNGDGVAVARPGRGSLLVLMVFTVAVLGTTALVSPYLFRTRDAKDGDANGQQEKGKGKGDSDGKGKKESDGDGKGQADGKGNGKGKGNGNGNGQGDGKENGNGSDGKGKGQTAREGHGQGQGHGRGNGKGHGQNEGKGQQGQGQGKGDQSQGEGDGSKGEPLDPPENSNASEAASEALSLGSKIFGWLLVVAVILLFLLLAVMPPIRRSFLLRHLERPLWPVSPTSRVMNLWRRAIASLAMVDIEPTAGESPRDFAGRARTELAAHLAWDARGLDEAAAIVEKIDYAGRGLGPTDEQTMREQIGAFVRELDARIGAGKKFKSAWGRAPEVES